MLFAILLYIIFFILGIAIALLLHLKKNNIFEYIEQFRTTPLAMSFFVYLLYSGYYLFLELKDMLK